MPTWAALSQVQGREAAEALAEACEEIGPEPLGSGVFEIEDGSDRWEVGVYYDDAPDEIALALIAAAQGAQPFAVSELPDVDWVAKVRRELSPVSAGRFFVHGSHDADKVPAGAEALCIEAAMAFGTGHHDTTRGCLLAFDRLLAQGERPARVADIGCGTAVLAMAAARVLTAGASDGATGDGGAGGVGGGAGAVSVTAGDIDPVAVETARANVAANALEGRVDCVMAQGFAHPLLHDRAPYDLVFANILKQPLIDLAPDMGRRLAPGGRAILSGILVHQAAEVAAAYAAAGMALERQDDLGDWTTLVVRRGD